MRVLVDEQGVARAAERAGLAPEQAARLWADLVRVEGSRSRVRDVAWYGGGLLTVVACGYFLGASWGAQGPAVGLAVAAVYAVAALLAAELLRARGQVVPAALLALLPVALVPVVAVALRDLTDLVTMAAPGDRSLGTWVREDQTLTALGLLVVGALVLRRYRRPFLLAAPLVGLGTTVVMLGDVLGLEVALGVLLVLGLLAAAAALDRAGRRDEGTWVHLALLVALEQLLWVEIDPTAATSALLHGLGGLAAVGVSVTTGRRLYLAAGGLGVFGALSWLSFEVFEGSLLFPVALAALGIAVVLGGVRLDAATART